MNVTAPLLTAVKKSPTEATLTIFGDIGPSQGFFGPTGMVDTEMVSKELSKLGDGITEIDVQINSKGGDAYEGVGICNLLKQHPANVTVTIVGVAASAASIIAMGGDTVIMPANGQMMIHEARGFAYGTKAEIENKVKQIDATNQAAITTYAEKTGLGEDEIRNMMAAETWMVGDEAKKKGFVDKITGKVKSTKNATTSPQQSLNFKHAPSNVIALLAITPPDLKDETMAQANPTAPAGSNDATASPETAPAAPQLAAAPASSPAPATTPTTVDLDAARNAGADAERTRQSEIRAVFQGAKLSSDANWNTTLDKAAEEFCAAPKMGQQDAKNRLLEMLTHRNQVPNAGTGTAPAPEQKTDSPIDGFKAEFAASKSVYQKMGVTEDAYIRTRCIDQGIEPPAAK